MRVAILTQYPLDADNVRGGVESDMVGFVNELEKYGDLELHVITCVRRQDTQLLIKKLQSKSISDDKRNFNVYYLSSPQLPRLITFATYDQYILTKKIKELKPDIVHAHMTAPLYGYQAIKSKYPTIVSVEGIVQEEAKTWPGITGLLEREIYTRIEKFVFENAEVLTVISPYVENKIRSWCKCDIYVIPNGVRKDFFIIKNNEVENRLLFVGGIEPRKGLLNLLKAMNIVKNEIPCVRLHIVGKVRIKEYFDSLIRFVKLNDLSNHVIFKENLNDTEVKREYGECSIFVFPSKEESLGIAPLEAMASGKPVIATNIGGIPYGVENGRTGILVEYGDITVLANEIIKLLKNRELREKFGRNGRERAKLFSHKENAKKYYNLYNYLINKQSKI